MSNHPSILVVEDDPTSRMGLASLLIEMGYDVTSAADGDEALNYLYSEASCDVILSDVIMPQMSGLELAQRAREARPGIPFVFVTGKVGGVDLAANAGCFALWKPVSPERLAQVLMDALD